MKDEVLQKVYATDTARIPRYQIRNRDGTVLYEGVEILLLNAIEQAGTPYSVAAVLPDELATAICPGVANPTPADAFRALNSKTIQTVVQTLTAAQQAQVLANLGIKSEVWTFTLDDESVVDKVVLLR